MPGAQMTSLANRNIVFVSEAPQETAKHHELLSFLRTAGCEIMMVDSAGRAMEAMGGGRRVDAILYDVGGEIAGAIDFLKTSRRSNAAQPHFFVVTDRLDSRFAEAYYEGAEAIWVRPFDIAELATGMACAFVTSQSYRNNERKKLRGARASYSVEQREFAGYAANISLGGAFIGSTDLLPKVGQTVRFSLVLEGDFPIEVTGRGVVKWVRERHESGRASGFGISFVDLGHAVSESLWRFLVNEERPS